MLKHILLLAVVVSQPVLAHELSADLGVGLTRATATLPRSGWLSLSAGGVYEPRDTLAFGLGVNVSRDTATKIGSTQVPSSNVVLLSGSAEWIPTEQLLLSLAGSVSPPTDQLQLSPITLVDGSGGTFTTDAVLRSRNSSLGALLAASFLTAGDKSFESAVDASVGVTRFATLQRVEPLSQPRLVEYCQRNPGARLCAVLNPQTDSLLQLRLSAGYTATLGQHTDLGLDGTYYLYDDDPSLAGYFALVSSNRSVELGSGLAVAPLHFTVRPSLARRFGDFSARLTYQYGAYVAQLGQNHTVGLKLRYRFSEAWRASLAVSVQVDRDDQGTTAPTGSATLGAVYAF